MLVLDCSTTAGWLIPDEASDASRALFREVVALGALVPTLWAVEVANLLVVSQRRGRLTAEDSVEALNLLDRLPIRTTAPAPPRSLIPLALEHSLTAYDTAYLELALRERLPLATLDKDLRKAARKAKVELV